VTILRGDCREQLANLDAHSVDACVTDPPYGLEFMGKDWDAPWKTDQRWNDQPHGVDNQRPTDEDGRSTGLSRWSIPRPRYTAGAAFQEWSYEWAAEVLRVLKPGGFLLAFGGTRTYHRLTCAIEDAGFEVRDSIAAWLYGSGFPKSLDVGKAIDKAAGAERRVIGAGRRHGGGIVGAGTSYELPPDAPMLTAPATVDAARWEGWGTALKPAWEPIVVARKPLEGTVAQNVLAHGVGGLNIAGCRVGTTDNTGRTRTTALGVMNDDGWQPKAQASESHAQGRWPANTVLAHHPGCGDDCHPDCWVATLDQQSGNRPGSHRQGHLTKPGSMFAGCELGEYEGYNDSGSASRFFPTFRYQAKAPTAERPKVNGVAHPTVKPLELMRWLCRLVTPPGGTILDPFLGSGTTAEAAELEGFRWVGCESNDDYLPLIQARLDRVAEVQLRLPA
jgi:DNA modification methylase